MIVRTKFGPNIKQAKDVAKRRIYWSDRKTKIEIAGYRIISGLLDSFHKAVVDLERVKWNSEKLSGRSQKLMRLMPDGISVKSRYEALLRVTDFISGMTDRYALELYRKLNGISI